MSTDTTAGGLSASEAARILGSIKSDRKAAAARENGKKGGRPRKVNAGAQTATPVGPTAQK